jgi:hypothetical protein
MNPQDVGLVLDHQTSRRRILVSLVPPGVVALRVEVYGQPHNIVELDAEGVGILTALLREAVTRLTPPMETR